MLRYRLLIASIIAEIAGILCYVLNPWITDQAIDFMWSIQAANNLLSNTDPYHRLAHEHFIPYPLIAAIIGLPIAWLPPRLAASLFLGLSSGLLAFGLTRNGQWWRLLVFVSAPYAMALKSVQWSPLLFAVLLLPTLIPVTLCKPTLGMAVAIQRMTWRRFAACAAFGLMSLIIMPDWPLRWFPQTQAYGGFIPLFVVPFGPLMLLALASWRTEQARHLLLMSLVPQHRYFYDALLLWHLPSTPLTMLCLTVVSWFALIAVYWLQDWGVAPQLTIFFLYLPALLIVQWPVTRNMLRTAYRKWESARGL